MPKRAGKTSLSQVAPEDRLPLKGGNGEAAVEGSRMLAFSVGDLWKFWGHQGTIDLLGIN